MKEAATNGAKEGAVMPIKSCPNICHCFCPSPHEPDVWQLSEMVQSMDSRARLSVFEPQFHLLQAVNLDELL